MALTIEQNPLYTINPVGQEVIFTSLDAATVSTYFKVKYIAQVHISETDIDLATSTAIGTFKTTPNNAGAGIFDFRPIVESYVNSDNLGALGSEYKGTATSALLPNPLHLIDKFSLNDNVVRYLKIRFKVEGSTTATGNTAIVGASADSDQFTLINGYLKHTDLLIRDFDGSFGYDLTDFEIGTYNKKFLTNAPTTQYANGGDYGTLSFFTSSSAMADEGYIAKFKYYNSSGVLQGSDSVNRTLSNGAYDTWNSDTKNQLLHLGCFPANLRNTSATFIALYDAGTLDGGYYTVQILSDEVFEDPTTQTYTINLNCPTLKGYEPIRLTWLNQWGVWDYYTFTMKSTKTTSTKGSTYEQLAGTWNESIYQPNGYRGGKKAFRVNATEKISMNTDFVNEAESEWFEELINSPEVYILEGFGADPTKSSLNTYVTPARLTTSNLTKKTVANDKLIQYTFEVEKSKTLRTQSI